jgi:alpha-ribazole phosphatase
VTRCWDAIRQDQAVGDTAVIAHGGVLRSILSGINETPLIDSFSVYSLHYGCAIRLFETEGRWRYEVLLNQAPAEKEQHKPKAFYQ